MQKQQSKWKLECLYPSIYHLQFANHYDAAMHFLRYQENYESPMWRDKQFTILEYMEWYAKTQCDWKKEAVTNRGTIKKKPVQMFTYPGDWGGFNLPSYVFDRVTLQNIPDPNHYDRFMHTIAQTCREMSVMSGPWYLIGTVDGPKATRYIDHEVAHGGFYYTLPAYFEYMNELIYEKTPIEPIQALRAWLLDVGYCEAVVMDETQACFATGIPLKIKKTNPKGYALCQKAQAPYKRFFKKTIEALKTEGFCHYV